MATQRRLGTVIPRTMCLVKSRVFQYFLWTW